MTHVARKRFGQHFLTDPGVVAQMLQVIDPEPGQWLVEIGPGQGVLTRALLDSGCQLTAIELDRDLAKRLRDELRSVPRFRLIQDDVLRVDLASLKPDIGRPNLRIVGNLPYNISSPLLFHLLGSPALIEDMHFMLQAEFVDRLVARPGSKAYGRLSVSAQLFCDCQRLFYVEPTAFDPVPKVRSAVVRVVPAVLPKAPVRDLSLFHAIVRDAFGQRRKTLRNTLKNHLNSADFDRTGIDPGRRAETLSIAEFAALANAVSQK